LDTSADFSGDIYVDLLTAGATWNVTNSSCPDWLGAWPTNQPRFGPTRGFVSNDQDVTFRSCGNSSTGSDNHFIFYANDDFDFDTDVRIVLSNAWFAALRFYRSVSVPVTVSVVRVRTAVSVPCTHHGPNGNGKIELDPIRTNERHGKLTENAIFT